MAIILAKKTAPNIFFCIYSRPNQKRACPCEEGAFPPTRRCAYYARTWVHGNLLFDGKMPKLRVFRRLIGVASPKTGSQ